MHFKNLSLYFIVMAIAVFSLLPLPAMAQAKGILQSIQDKMGEQAFDEPQGPWTKDLKLQRYLNYYNTQKPVHLTPEMLQRLADTGYLDQAPEKQNYIIGFFSIVFKDNPKLVTVWLNQVNLTQYQAGAFVRAARYAGLGEEIEMWAKAKGWTYSDEEVFTDLTPPLISNAETPEDVQRVWGAYVADGDRAYLDKLYNLLLISDVPLDEAEINQGDYRTFKLRAVNEIIEGLFIRAGVQYDVVYEYLRNKTGGSNVMQDRNLQLRRIMANIVDKRSKEKQ